MNSLRSLLVVVLTFIAAQTGRGLPVDEEDEKAETWAQMHRAWAAIMAYKKDHGQVPDHLSDLIPGYVPDPDALISPTEQRTGRHGDFTRRGLLPGTGR